MFGAILGAASQLAGGLINKSAQSSANRTNVNIMRETNEFNAKEAQLNRDFQVRQSNSAYQRAMQDMKKAGLNPMLAYSLGGASTPSGGQATASGTTVQAETMGDALSQAFHSAQEARRLKSELKLQDANLTNVKETTAKIASDKKKVDADRKKTELETKILKKEEPISSIKEKAGRLVEDKVLPVATNSAKKFLKTADKVWNKKSWDNVGKALKHKIKNFFKN